MKPDALIVIDVQAGLLELHPYHEAALIANIQRLLAACRNNNIPVIYIQHEEDVEGGLVHGSDAWQVAAPIAPQASEKRFEKRYNSAFRHTGLHEYLQQIGAKNLILCGMQTEYCVDTTTKVAFELGYDVRIPADGTSTYDNKYFKAADLINFYQWDIWHDCFAQVVPVDALIASIQE